MILNTIRLTFVLVLIYFVGRAYAQQSADECRATTYYLAANLMSVQTNANACMVQLQAANKQIDDLKKAAAPQTPAPAPTEDKK